MPASTLPKTSSTETASTQSAKPRLPLVVYILALGTFLMVTTEFVIAGILPEIADDLQVSLAQTGHLITVFAVGMIVGAPSMALLTLRMSKRLVLVLAVLVFIAGHVVVALGAAFWLLMVARFVTALATGAFWAVAAVVAARIAGPSVGSRALGVVSAGGALATVLGVPLGAFIAQLVGWRGTFWALAATATVAVVLIARFVPADTGSTPGQSTSLRTEVAGLRSGRLWLALLACVLTNGGILAAYTYISPILTDHAGVAAVLVPVLLTCFGIGSLAGTLLAGRLGDAHPHIVTIVTPAVSTLVLLLLTLIVDVPWAATVLVVLLGLFGMSANGVLIHLVVTAAGEAGTLGSALSVSAFNLGTAIGTGIAGIALESSLGISGPLIVGTVIVALTLIPTIALGLRIRGTTTTRQEH